MIKIIRRLKAIKVEHFAMIFLTIGIIVLYLMSLATKPVFVNDYSDLGNYEGKTVVIDGIIIDYDETSRGESILTVLEPDDLESTLKVFIETCSRNFTIGDKIRVKGSVLRINEEFLELVVINEKDIEITGHWHHLKLSIPDLAHRLELNPGEFRSLPVEISGYLKYEPRTPITSLRLSEDSCNGLYTVKIDIPYSTPCTIELHKGDLVSVNVSVEYNENNFEYKLILENLTLLKSYGDWFVTLPELQDAPFVYEGARVNTSGYLHDYESYYDYILVFDSPSGDRWDSNCSIWVDISGLDHDGINLQDDYFITIFGTLYYDPQYFDYAIKAEKIFII